MCMEVEYLTFYILLHATSEQKRKSNYFCTLIIFKSLLKTGFSLRKILITILCQVCLDCNVYFLFEKQAFSGLLKVINI